MTKVEDGWVLDSGTKVEKKSKGVVSLKSGAILTKDDLDNVWYHSDIEIVIGKITRGRFVPTPRQDFSPELLAGVAQMFDQLYPSK
jgi:hypothetical protein